MEMKTNNLTVSFKNKIIAVNQVNLKIESGIYGLLGENGAGKTTLMRVMSTILQQTSGSLSLDGLQYNNKNNAQIRAMIGYLPQELNLYPNLTVRESLNYLGELSGLTKSICRERVDYYLEKTNLIDQQNKKNRQLSGGMKRRVGLAQAMLHNPKFLIVDEPTTGLDPEERIRIRNLLVDFSKERAVLFSTHVVEDLAATCNQLAIMKKGNIIFNGNMINLLTEAKGHIFLYETNKEEDIYEIQKRYITSSKQYNEQGMTIKIISREQPDIFCSEVNATLEDAYIYKYNF